MAIATVTFRRCLVNASEAGSDEAQIVSRVFFDLTIGGKEFVDVYVDVTQATREEDAPLFVTPLQGYDGPLNLPVFQGLVEFYYRQVTGGSLAGLGLRLRDWMIEQEMVVQFEV